MKMILICGLLKADVLLALYNHAKYGGIAYVSNPVMRKLGRMSRNGSLEKAKQIISERHKSERWYFEEVDLGEGPRQLKVDLGDIEFDAEEFDKAHGEGQAARAISALRTAFETAMEATSLDPNLKCLFDIAKEMSTAYEQRPAILTSVSSTPPKSEGAEGKKAAPRSMSGKVKKER